jgi:hypothetical protein
MRISRVSSYKVSVGVATVPAGGRCLCGGTKVTSCIGVESSDQIMATGSGKLAADLTWPRLCQRWTGPAVTR